MKHAFQWFWKKIKWTAQKSPAAVKWFFRESHWGGLIPALILGIFAYIAFLQTKEQLNILKEEISYSRQRVVQLFIEPNISSRAAFRNKLFISNIGNEAVKNVTLRFGLFFVNENKIYSYGQFQNTRAYVADTTQTARNKLWPFFTIEPDKRFEITDRLNMVIDRPLYDLSIAINDEAADQELAKAQDIFKGECVLFAEYSFRRESDYAQQVDTNFFLFLPFERPVEDLNSIIGGKRIIDRLKKYMEDGPELSINIYKDRYDVFKHVYRNLLFEPIEIVERIPRKQ